MLIKLPNDIIPFTFSSVNNKHTNIRDCVYQIRYGVVVISNILRGMVRYNSSTLADINNSVAGDDDYQDTTLIDGQCV